MIMPGGMLLWLVPPLPFVSVVVVDAVKVLVVFADPDAAMNALPGADTPNPVAVNRETVLPPPSTETVVVDVADPIDVGSCACVKVTFCAPPEAPNVVPSSDDPAVVMRPAVEPPMLSRPKRPRPLRSGRLNEPPEPPYVYPIAWNSPAYVDVEMLDPSQNSHSPAKYGGMVPEAPA